MWSVTSNNGKLRHMWGGRGDPNAETLHSLCGESGKGPLDYLQIHLDKCSRCEAIKKRKEAKDARNIGTSSD